MDPVLSFQALLMAHACTEWYMIIQSTTQTHNGALQHGTIQQCWVNGNVHLSLRKVRCTCWFSHLTRVAVGAKPHTRLMNLIGQSVKLMARFSASFVLLWDFLAQQQQNVPLPLSLLFDLSGLKNQLQLKKFRACRGGQRKAYCQLFASRWLMDTTNWKWREAFHQMIPVGGSSAFLKSIGETKRSPC